MRALLDTQVFLWFLADDRRLPKQIRAAIISPVTAAFVSAASIWEIAIKAALGRVEISARDVERLPELIDASGFNELPVRAHHAAGVRGLPPHHADPFDRLLVAQARAESMALATVDRAIRAYDVALL